MGFIPKSDQRFIDFFLRRAASKAAEEIDKKAAEEETESALRELFNINSLSLLAIGATIASLEEQDYKAFLSLLQGNTDTVINSYQNNFLPIYPESMKDYHSATVHHIYNVLIECIEATRRFLRDFQAGVRE